MQTSPGIYEAEKIEVTAGGFTAVAQSILRHQNKPGAGAPTSVGGFGAPYHDDGSKA